MGIYAPGEDNLLDESFGPDDKEALSLVITSAIMESMQPEEFNAFCESAECEVLVEKGLIHRKTLIRLSKQDDLDRRRTMAAMQLAKNAKAPSWKKYKKFIKLAKAEKRKMVELFGSRGERVAKKAQVEYLRTPILQRITPEKFNNAKQ